MSETIFSWIKAGLIKPDHIQHALEVAGERPSRPAWLNFVKRFLVMLGLLSMAFGVVFFFAYNWNEMGRMFKFIILQVMLVCIFSLYYFKANSQWVKQALLLSAVIVLGALLALFGQTYQTGADPWQLFSTWAMLITPLVLFSRSEILWVVLAILLNTALSLYLQVNRSLFGFGYLYHHLPWAFFMLNGVLLVCVEFLSMRPAKNWLQTMQLRYRWGAQIIGLMVLFILAMMGFEGIWGRDNMRGLNMLFYIVSMATTFVYYRYKCKDLLLLTAWSFALIVFILALLADSVFDNFDAGGLLLMAISLIGMSTFTVSRIKLLHETFKAEKSS